MVPTDKSQPDVPPPEAARGGGGRPGLLGLLNSKVGRVGAFATAAAGLTTAVATLTSFGQNLAVSGRQLVFSPRVEITRGCGRRAIEATLVNKGWSSIAVTKKPVVVWTQDGVPRPPALFTVAAIDASGEPRFPIALDPGKSVSLRLQNEDGFYWEVDPLDRNGGKCSVKITFAVANQPPPAKATVKDVQCPCV